MSQMPPGSPPPYGAPPPPYAGSYGPPVGAPPYGAPPAGGAAPYVVAAPARSSGPSVGLVLGLIGAAVLVVMGTLGGVGYWFYGKVRGAEERARTEARERADEARARQKREEERSRIQENDRRVKQLEAEIQRTTDPATRAALEAQRDKLKRAGSTSTPCAPGDPLCP